jgi:hypothetical protein
MVVVALNPTTGNIHDRKPVDPDHNDVHRILLRLTDVAPAITIHHINGADVRYELRQS